MLFAVSAALFYCLARAFRRGLTPRLAVAIGVVIAVGFLTKLNFIGLVPGMVLAPASCSRGAARARRGAARPTAPLAAGARRSPRARSACTCVVNLLSDHAGLGSSRRASQPDRQDRGSLVEEVSYIWQLYLPRLPGMVDYFPGLSTIRQLWFDRAVGLYGWLDTTSPTWVYSVALIPAGADRDALRCARCSRAAARCAARLGAARVRGDRASA